MKKKFFKLYFTIFFIFIIIFSNAIYIYANNTYFAPVTFTSADLYFTTSWGNRQVLAATSSICENIDGTSFDLTSLPKIILESTDGTIQQWVYVEKQGNKTYFDVVFDNLDFSKNYIFKVRSTSPYNTSEFQQLTLLDDFIAIPSKDTYVTIKDSVITFSNTYSAPVSTTTADLYFTTSWGNRQVLAATSSICESIDGTSFDLTSLPKIILESTDGTIQQWVYVEKQGNKTYFDVVFDNLDFSKNYIFKVRSTSPNNTATFQQLTLLDDFIAIPSKNTYVTIKDSIITFSNTYSAELCFEPVDLYFVTDISNNNYIAGLAKIFVKDNTGITFLPPTLPTVELWAKDGTFYKTAYLEQVENRYYFSVMLDNLDLTKTYYIRIKDNSPNNASSLSQKNLWVNSVNNNSYMFSVSEKDSYLSFSRKIFIGTYGQSGLKEIGDSRGTDLKYYKIGSGENVLFATFAIHGYEDLWAADGKELTIIAEEFTQKLALANDEQIMNNWTIYVFPQCNPDGVNYGYTNYGPGRCTLTGVSGHSVDMNRCWSTSFEATYSARNYTGATPFEAYEAIYLRDFMLANKSQYGQTIVIDLHGWTTQLIGDRGICLDYFGLQFYGTYSNSLSKYTSTYGKGYLVNWARTNLSNLNGVSARSALIELPSAGIANHTSVVNAGYSQKYYNAIVNMLKGIL